MTLENTSLKQHGRMVALAGVLLATACGGTFSGTGSAGAAGSGTGGEGAGWRSAGGVGTGGGFVCNSECPLIACNGVSMTPSPASAVRPANRAVAPAGSRAAWPRAAGPGLRLVALGNGFACPAIACPAGCGPLCSNRELAVGLACPRKAQARAAASVVAKPAVRRSTARRATCCSRKRTSVVRAACPMMPALRGSKATTCCDSSSSPSLAPWPARSTTTARSCRATLTAKRQSAHRSP